MQITLVVNVVDVGHGMHELAVASLVGHESNPSQEPFVKTKVIPGFMDSPLPDD